MWAVSRAHCQNKHLDGDDVKVKGQFYKYPHSFPDHWIEQQYLPDILKDRQYYAWGDNKNEQAFRQYWEHIREKHAKRAAIREKTVNSQNSA